MCTLSRLTHALLVVAVIALSVALIQAHHAAGPQATINASPAGNAMIVTAPRDQTEVAILPAGLFDELDIALAQSDDLGIGGFDSHQNGNSTPPSAPKPAAGPEQAADPANIPLDGQRDRPGRRGSMPDRGGSPHGPPRLTAELVDRCIEIAREADSELGSRLAEARDKNPQEFERLMRQGGFGWRLMSMAQLKQRDPELYKAKVAELSQSVQIERTAKQLREAKKNGSQGDIDSYEHQLRTMLQIQLAMSIKARGEMLCHFDERVIELRKDLEREAVNFQTTIEARMKSLSTEPPAAATVAPATPAPAAPPAK